MGRITAVRFLKAMKGSGGILAVIGKRLSVTRQGVWQWLETNPEFKQCLKQEEESVLDLAEGKLIDQVNNGEMWAVKYLLSTKGKKRGYVEKDVTFNAYQTNLQQANYKFIIEKPDDIRNTVETKPEAATGV